MAKDQPKRTPPACAGREVLDRVGDQWSCYIMLMLEGGTLRFGELKNKVEGISPRVLTQNLRSLEQDGLVTRRVYPTVPLRVDYAITELGLSLAAALRPLVQWAEENQPVIDEHRRLARAAEAV